MLTDQNRRIAMRMSHLIDEFQSKTIRLRELVRGLEGSVLAMEPALSSEQQTRFFEIWESLEIAAAVGEEDPDDPETVEALEKLKVYIANLLSGGSNAEDR